jgi:serine/threonine protein kinase
MPISKGLLITKLLQAHYGQANILISADHHALLADFGLMNVVSDSGASYADSSASVGGTDRWMSPELLYPEHFNLSHVKPTVASDVYALGMVILEVAFSFQNKIPEYLTSRLKVLTGAHPFVEITRSHSINIHVVMHGKRPVRPANSANMGISDAMWQLLQSCWTADSAKRPGVKVVRKFLQQATPTWEFLPPMQAPAHDKDDTRTETASSTSSGTMRRRYINGQPEPNAEIVSVLTALTFTFD